MDIQQNTIIKNAEDFKFKKNPELDTIELNFFQGDINSVSILLWGNIKILYDGLNTYYPKTILFLDDRIHVSYNIFCNIQKIVENLKENGIYNMRKILTEKERSF